MHRQPRSIGCGVIRFRQTLSSHLANRGDKQTNITLRTTIGMGRSHLDKPSYQLCPNSVFPIWTMCPNITFSHRLSIINQSAALNWCRNIGAAVTQSPAALYDGASPEQKKKRRLNTSDHRQMNPRSAVPRKCKRFQKQIEPALVCGYRRRHALT